MNENERIANLADQIVIEVERAKLAYLTNQLTAERFIWNMRFIIKAIP